MCHFVILRSRPSMNSVRGLAVTLFAAAVSWAVAALSWKWFEKPLVDRGHRLSRAPVVLPAQAPGTLAY
jgi:peptidoglycan/LPS O-acetylase OafA/YrhL